MQKVQSKLILGLLFIYIFCFHSTSYAKPVVYTLIYNDNTQKEIEIKKGMGGKGVKFVATGSNKVEEVSCDDIAKIIETNYLKSGGIIGVGGLAGAGAGAAIGSIFPGIGTVIGAALGFIFGSSGTAVASDYGSENIKRDYCY